MLHRYVNCSLVISTSRTVWSVEALWSQTQILARPGHLLRAAVSLAGGLGSYVQLQATGEYPPLNQIPQSQSWSSRKSQRYAGEDHAGSSPNNVV